MSIDESFFFPSEESSACLLSYDKKKKIFVTTALRGDLALVDEPYPSRPGLITSFFTTKYERRNILDHVNVIAGNN